MSDNKRMMAVSDNQRAFQRYPVSMTVLVQRIDDNGIAYTEREKARRAPTASVVVTDISVSGLVFTATRPHPPGAVVEIQFCLGVKVFQVGAVVRRVQTLSLPGRRLFRCAAQFVRGEDIAEFIPAIAKYLQQTQKTQQKAADCVQSAA